MAYVKLTPRDTNPIVLAFKDFSKITDQEQSERELALTIMNRALKKTDAFEDILQLVFEEISIMMVDDNKKYICVAPFNNHDCIMEVDEIEDGEFEYEEFL